MTTLSRIREIVPEHDPRHVAAVMRIEFHVLDDLSEERFEEEALFAGMCVQEAGRAASERLAQCFGL